jgi:AraC-like DNA-binding protein
MNRKRGKASDPFAPIKRTEAHYILQSLLTNYFGINVSVLPSGTLSWRPLAHYWHDHSPHNYEALYRGRATRDAYHARHFKRVIREKRTVLGDWGGYSDLYVPVVKGGRCVAHIWSGQFARAPLTRPQVDSQWREYTGRQPSLLDPEYLDFVRVALQTPVFDTEALKAYQTVLELLAEWIAGEKPPERIFREAETLRCGAVSDCLPNATWLTTVIRKDRLAWVPWTDRVPEWVRDEIRITRTPTHVMCVATVPSPEGREDLVDALIREQGLRRGLFRFARTLPQSFGGEFEGNAVLLTSPGTGKRDVQGRLEIRERADALRTWAERTFRVRAVVGVGGAHGIEDLHLSYAEAVSSMHQALETGQPLVLHGGSSTSPKASAPGDLHRLSRRLVEAVDRQSPAETASARARYVEAVLAQSRLRPEAVRMHLLGTVLSVLDGAVRRHPGESSFLAEKAAPMVARMERSRTLRESLELFRTVLAEWESFLRRPREGARDARLKSVLVRLEAECHRPLRLPQAAKWAGLSASAFTRTFRARTGRSFPAYMTRLRVERAKSLLVSGNLPVAQVAHDCGFSTPAYFIQAFRRVEGVTPAKYRARNQAGG